MRWYHMAKKKGDNSCERGVGMKRIRTFFSAFYRRYGGWVACYVLLTVLHKALAFATPQALQKLIDSAVAGQRAVYSRWPGSGRMG